MGIYNLLCLAQCLYTCLLPLLHSISQEGVIIICTVYLIIPPRTVSSQPITSLIARNTPPSSQALVLVSSAGSACSSTSLGQAETISSAQGHLEIVGLEVKIGTRGPACPPGVIAICQDKPSGSLSRACVSCSIRVVVAKVVVHTEYMPQLMGQCDASNRHR